MEFPHRPVMVREVLEYLVTDPGDSYVDGTAGSGGHSEAIGRKLNERGRLICMDRDPEAVAICAERLSFLGDRVRAVRANYSDIDQELVFLGIQGVSGVLLDLGMSTYQLDYSGRGFSFTRDEPLDMRMDPEGVPDAKQLVNTLSSKELEVVLRRYGEEKRARAIAGAISRERKKKALSRPLN